MIIRIETRTGTIHARVWKLAVGRNTLLLLDSNVEGNQPEDRELTARLYGGDSRVRIRQELLLGVGGMRALAALGISPGVVHLNEGHSAFAGLELVRQRMETEGIEATEAIRRVSAQIVFTTHTPGPGRPRPLSRRARRRASRPAARVDAPQPRSLHGARPGQPLRLGRRVLHDRAGAASCRAAPTPSRRCTARSRARCGSALFPGRSKSRCRSATSPTASTSSPGWRRRCASSTTAIWGPTGRGAASNPGFWEAIDKVDDGELWETHQTLKTRLVDFARRRVVRHAERRGEGARIHRPAEARA